MKKKIELNVELRKSQFDVHSHLALAIDRRWLGLARRSRFAMAEWGDRRGPGDKARQGMTNAGERQPPCRFAAAPNDVWFFAALGWGKTGLPASFHSQIFIQHCSECTGALCMLCTFFKRMQGPGPEARDSKRDAVQETHRCVLVIITSFLSPGILKKIKRKEKKKKRKEKE